MSKNNDNPVTAVETVIDDAVKDKLVTPSVPSQTKNEKTIILDSPEDEEKPNIPAPSEDDEQGEQGEQASAPKFHAVIGGTEGEVHHFDTVAGLLKHVTISAFKSRTAIIAAAATVTATAAIYAVTRVKPTEVIELTDEENDEDSVVYKDAEDIPDNG